MKWKNGLVVIIFLMLLYLSFPAFIGASVDYPQTGFQQYSLLNIASQDVITGDNWKSPEQAFVFSAIIPGTGELYSGAIKRGVFFMASEIALWTSYVVFHGKADNYQDEYIEFVDQHIVFEEDSPASSTANWTLEDYEHATQADNWHYVYTETSGEPIERVGKFYWDDLPQGKIDEDGGVPIDESNSKSRIIAFEKRGLANDKYKQSKIFLGLVVVNHIVSAIDARIAATMRNNRAARSNFNVSFHPTLTSSGGPGIYAKLMKNF